MDQKFDRETRWTLRGRVGRPRAVILGWVEGSSDRTERPLCHDGDTGRPKPVGRKSGPPSDLPLQVDRG